MKNGKKYMGFCIPKICKNLKHFSGAFRQAKKIISEDCTKVVHILELALAQIFHLFSLLTFKL